MRHLLIAETQLRAIQHIGALEKARCFSILLIENGYWEVRLPNGRHDQIKFMNHEHDAPWGANVANILRDSNSFATDEAYYYARRTVSWTHDPLTTHWALFTKDAYIDFNPLPERLVFVQCMESIDASQKQIRKR